MTKNLYLLDTCTFARQYSYPDCARIIDYLIGKGQFVLSAVVAMELYTGTHNKAAKQSLDKLSSSLHKVGMVATPQYEDFQRAGVVLKSYSQRKGHVKTSPHFRDILICLSALRIGSTVVTDNLDDFLRWQKEIERNFQKKISVISTAELLALYPDPPL